MARYYEPKHGAFLSIDPDPGDEDDIITQNGYTYANNNPVMLVDPDGHWVWLAVNAGFAAYDGYKAYKAGKGWKGVAKAAAMGAIGGKLLKGAKVASRIYKSNKLRKVTKKINFDSTAGKHMGNSGRYVPIQIQARAIVYGKKNKGWG